MGATLRHQLGRAKAEGYDLAFLGGQRQRYGYFGFETCGVGYTATFNRSNLRHFTKAQGPSPLTVAPLRPDDHQKLAAVMALHAALLIKLDRSAGGTAGFYRHLVSWRNSPLVATEAATGEVVGLMVVDGGEAAPSGSVTELLCRAPADASRMIQRLLADRAPLEGDEGEEAEFKVTLSPADVGVTTSLGSWAESMTIGSPSHTSMYAIYNWAPVVDALLKLQFKLAGGPHIKPHGLAIGVVTIELAGVGVLELSVSEKTAGCKLLKLLQLPDPEAAAVPCQPEGGAALMRALFGPTPPALALGAGLGPEAALLLHSWCPLPLFWAPQDGA